MYISMEKHFEKDFRRDPRHTQYLADTMNKKMPRMLDDVTRIDRAESDGNVLRMTYTILEGETEGIEDIVRSRFLVLLCSEPAFHDLMRQGLEMEHVYHSADGVEVGRVNINDSVCYIPPVEDWGL